jgi:hypothetical protein
VFSIGKYAFQKKVSIAATAGYFQQHERLGYDPQGSHNTPVEPEQRLSVLLELEAAPVLQVIYSSEGTILNTNGATKVAAVPFPPSL